jgi:hypothetical protein
MIKTVSKFESNEKDEYKLITKKIKEIYQRF